MAQFKGIKGDVLNPARCEDGPLNRYVPQFAEEVDIREAPYENPFHPFFFATSNRLCQSLQL